MFICRLHRRIIYTTLNLTDSAPDETNIHGTEKKQHKEVIDKTFQSDLLKDESIQIISNMQRIKQLYLSLIRRAQRELLLIFPTTNSIRREEKVGVFAEARRAYQRGVTVRILAPEDDFIKAYLNALRNDGIIIRPIESPSEVKFKLLIVDRRFSLVIETQDDRKASFEEAVGLATLSNSKPTVLPYVTIFESFWRETDLYEKAREADRIKDEFVNIVAHELRNPIMPIMAGSDFAIEELEMLRQGRGSISSNNDHHNREEEIIDSLTENINIISRNASRLFRLSEDILQVSRMESGTFVLNLEPVDLKVMLAMVIQDAQKKVKIEGKSITIELDDMLTPLYANARFVVCCDNSKMSQVLYNLLDNAIKFTQEGTITISTARFNENSIIVKIKDSGIGIDPTIIGRLFEKFSTKSKGGTGLGLYISRKIIEAHAGRIWGENNPSDEYGAIFSFILPIDPGRMMIIAEQQSMSQIPHSRPVNDTLIDVIDKQEGNNDNLDKQKSI